MGIRSNINEVLVSTLPASEQLAHIKQIVGEPKFSIVAGVECNQLSLRVELHTTPDGKNIWATFTYGEAYRSEHVKIALDVLFERLMQDATGEALEIIKIKKDH